MATQSRKSGLPEFLTDTQSAENLRRQFIEAPMEAAGQAALGSAAELATLMSILPDAFVASQRRELKRVQESGNENDPRVAALQASIEQAGLLQTMALRGEARVRRALVALASSDKVFHGFVSDADFAPLKGLTVRLTDRKAHGANAISATTDDDGYFNMTLGTKSDTTPDSQAKAKPINLSQRIADFLAGLSQEPSAPPAAGAEENVSQVEILKDGKLLYSDPVFVVRDGGSIYREYVITNAEPSSASDFNPPSRRADPTERAAEAPQPDTAGPAARARKRSARGAKSSKPRSKK
jgi:hypothetical protein